jgi:hypothetical protein
LVNIVGIVVIFFGQPDPSWVIIHTMHTLYKYSLFVLNVL